MARILTEGRVCHVEGPGKLIVASDLHGNFADFLRLVELRESHAGSVLLLLGDLFHGPDAAEDEWDELYYFLGDYYPDESPKIFGALEAQLAAHPAQVRSLMGNHEHAHVGGPVVSKFHEDEAAYFESQLDPDAVGRLATFIEGMPLLATTTSGVVLTHAAAPQCEFSLSAVVDTDISGYEDVPLHKMIDAGFLGEVLWRRGSSLEGTESFLRTLTAESGYRCDLVVHGHERVDEGFDLDNERMLNLSTSFGMVREDKTILILDLERQYRVIEDLRIGVELVPLWSPS